MNYKIQQQITRMKLRPRTVPSQEYDDHDKEFMDKTSIYNRKRQREKLRDKRFTKKGYNFGRKIGGHQDNLIHWLAKVQAEKV